MYINDFIKNYAVWHVIRNGKRYGRYELHLGKDLKRIKFLLKRTTDIKYRLLKLNATCIALQGAGEELTPQAVSGWRAMGANDWHAIAGSDLLEIVAFCEYWSLWNIPEIELLLTA